ncbi:MAG: polysaccharide deacetylase family protein [Chloroflexi bacterium]|nr:MAG: polysaccharide deacetylase family protein [Chloroflexota bacterium]
MRRQLGIIVAASFYYSGLVKLARWHTERSGPGLVILNYHRASGGDLRRHLLYLRRHYRLLHLEAALEELYAPHKEKKGDLDRRTPLVLTFDDGYHDNYTHAFALACELQVPITIFLIPGYIQSGEHFWWLEGKRLASNAQMSEVTIDDRTYYLGKTGEQRALALAIDTRLRHAGSVKEREAFLASARELLGVTEGVIVEGEIERCLTWAEVHEMEESDWVSFGAHTMHHPILAYLADPQEVQHEVQECRTLLEQQLGHPVRTFAYPVGKPEHIGEHSLCAVQAAGFTWAVTTMHGTNTRQSDPHLLRRVLGDVSRHWLVMAAETSGVWHLFSPLWKKKSAVSAERDKASLTKPVAPLAHYEQN